MADSTTIVSGVIDNAVRIYPRPQRDADPTMIVRRGFPRGTQKLAPVARRVDDRVQTAIWFALGGLMTVVAAYLVF